MDGATYSTYEVRLRAVRAVVDENLPVATVALAYGTDRSTIHRWVAGYQVAGGVEGLIRQPVSGRPRKIESIDRKALTAIVLAPATYNITN